MKTNLNEIEKKAYRGDRKKVVTGNSLMSLNCETFLQINSLFHHTKRGLSRWGKLLLFFSFQII